MLESGRQPGYGKKQQLIPDGLNSKEIHLSRVMQLEHPFHSLAALKEDHAAAVIRQHLGASELNVARLRELTEWRALCKSSDVRELQCAHEQLASLNAKKLGRKPQAKYCINDLPRPQVPHRGQGCPVLCLTERNADSGQGSGANIF